MGSFTVIYKVKGASKPGFHQPRVLSTQWPSHFIPAAHIYPTYITAGLWF